jgi:hypothetical protein
VVSVSSMDFKKFNTTTTLPPFEIEGKILTERKAAEKK